MILMNVGFHTVLLLLMIQYGFAKQLIRRILSGEHSLVYIPENSDSEQRKSNRKYGRLRGNAVYYDIVFKQKYCGISFELRIPIRRLPYMNRHKTSAGIVVVSNKTFVEGDVSDTIIPNEMYCCSLRARVNPKILGGVEDYLTPAGKDVVSAMVDNFNKYVSLLSPTLRPFDEWKVDRLDYCMNISLVEYGLDIGEGLFGKSVVVTPDDYMVLIRMGRSPYSYHYHEKSVAEGNNAYLGNTCATINIYCKGDELKKRHADAWTPEADSILRVEIQYKSQKMYMLCRNLTKASDVFDERMGLEIILKYWKKMVGLADWYSMAEAKKLVHEKCVRSNREKRLVAVLERVAHRRGIDAARKNLDKNELVMFDRGLKELEEMGVNPVTIPKERKIKHIQNPVRVVLENGTPAVNIGSDEEDPAERSPTGSTLSNCLPIVRRGECAS